MPIFPSFLEFHFDEIPLFIAGFAYGPLVAFGSILVKTIIKLPFTGTMLVGELSDLLFSTAFVLPSAIIYKKMRNIKGGAYYKYCTRCGRKMQIKWCWQFLLGSWWMNNVFIPDANGVMARQCRGYWSH